MTLSKGSAKMIVSITLHTLHTDVHKFDLFAFMPVIGVILTRHQATLWKNVH